MAFAEPISRGEIFVNDEAIKVVVDPFRDPNSRDAWLSRHTGETFLWVSHGFMESLCDEDTCKETFNGLNIKETDWIRESEVE